MMPIMQWPWSRRRDIEPSNVLTSISDPSLAALFSPGGLADFSDIIVGEASALGLSAVFRAVSLISGTLAMLPLRSLREDPKTEVIQRVPSVFDDPDGPDGQTVFEWKETLFLHSLLYGRAGALKVFNQAGGLARLPLVHPLSWYTCEPTREEHNNPDRFPVGGIWFIVTLNDGTQVKLDNRDFFYVPAMTSDKFTGLGLLNVGRQSMATSISADRSAARMFKSGAMISGIATPADDLEVIDDIPELRRQINNAMTGYENAGGIAIVNRRLNFSPWTMTNSDAQFLQSRQFQIEEISRWTGVPPHLLMQTDKQTSWGTGVDEQNRAMGRTVLAPWASRLEQRASRLLAKPRWVEFDFSGLERPSPKDEVALIISEIGAGLLTIDEGRALRNRPPLPQTEGLDVRPELDEDSVLDPVPTTEDQKQVAAA
jgi:HK97 family phage portal protein